MTQPALPDLGRIHATLAANHARVAQSAAVLSGWIDELVSAAARQDWAEVERVGRDLAANSRTQGYRVLSGLAERVSEESQRPNNDVGIKRTLIRLIGTYGRTGRPVNA